MTSTVAEEALKSALEKLGMPVWLVGKASEEYKLGILFGVSLKYPEPEICDDPVGEIKSVTEQTAEDHGLKAIGYGPAGAAGGALVVYAGFESEYAEYAAQL